MTLVIGGTGPLSAVTDPWSAPGPAYTNPRPATDLLMSTYDTGQTDPITDMQTAADAAAAVAQIVGRARLLMDSRLHYSTAAAATVGTNGVYSVWKLLTDLTGRQAFVEVAGLSGKGTVPMNTGAVGGGGTIIESTNTTAITWNGTNGLPSLLGGPSFLSGGGGRNAAATSGLNLALSNLTLRLPNNSPIAGVDASNLQGFEADYVVWDTPQWASMPGSGHGNFTTITMPTQANMIGLLVPGVNAQENSRIGHIYVSGYRVGAYLNELSVIERLDVVGCYLVVALGQAYHPCTIRVLGDYNNAIGAGGYNPGTGNTVIASDVSPHSYFISAYWDKQPGDSQMIAAFNRQYDVYDPNNSSPIQADLVRVDANVGRVTGGHLVYGSGGLDGPWGGHIHDLTASRQPRTPPSLPASTTNLRNPFWQVCLVTVTGGTFTDVKINGVSAGTGGTYLVPASASISVTYTVAPTWTWQGI